MVSLSNLFQQVFYKINSSFPPLFLLQYNFPQLFSNYVLIYHFCLSSKIPKNPHFLMLLLSQRSITRSGNRSLWQDKVRCPCPGLRRDIAWHVNTKVSALLHVLGGYVRPKAKSKEWAVSCYIICAKLLLFKSKINYMTLDNTE